MNVAAFFGSQVFDHLWMLNVRAAFLAVIVAFVCFIGHRRLTPGCRAFLWLLVFIRVVVPFGPSSTLSLENILNASTALRTTVDERIHAPLIDLTREPIRQQRPIEGAVPSIDPDREGLEARTKPAMMTHANRWSLRDVCIGVWLVVAVFLLARLGWLRAQLSHEFSKLEVIRHADILQLAISVAAETNLKKVPRLLWGASLSSPAVCGWMYPALILPKDSPILDPSRLRTVLLHELRHIRAADTLLTWLLRVLCMAFWFNPLLWYASRKWHEERELSCDEWVLRRIGLDHRRSYLETLVEVVTRSSQSPSLEFTVNIVSNVTLLERRIVAMKRYRPSNWNGWVAASVLTVVVGSLGLTDAVRATIETESESDSVRAVAAANDDSVSPPANSQGPKPAEKQTLKPKIIFAKHVILWEGSEVLTNEQLKERLAKLRSVQPVKPDVYHSQGFASKGRNKSESQEEANKRLHDNMQSSLDLVGKDQWSMLAFMLFRGSGAVDRIKTQDDLKPDPTRSLKGKVITHALPETNLTDTSFGRIGTTPVKLGTHPAKGAQIVILPFGVPGSINLRDGKLRDPIEEFYYETNAEGMFEADPTAWEFEPMNLHGSGNYLTLILHETGYLMINGQLAASDATYELQPWTNVTIDRRNLKENEQVEIWMTPAGAHPNFSGFIIGWVGHGAQPCTVKLPRGTGTVDYQRKTGDQWKSAEFRHDLKITDDGPKEIELPAIP